MADTIANDVVVTIDYTLKDAEGAVIDSSAGHEPLSYLHGHGNIVPGLERALDGLAAGASAAVAVPPEDGYGLRSEGTQQVVPRDAFPPEISEGMQLMAQTETDSVVPIWIAKIDADEVVIDTNHPLAGATLHFEVEVVELRAATAEELAHGHPHGRHGTEGHHH